MSSTLKQRKLAYSVLANRGKTKKEQMIAAGYSVSQSKNPQQIFESKGFRQIFDEAGLSFETISKEWKKLLKKEDKELSISNKDKISALAVLTKVHFQSEQNKKQSNQINFINKFINTKELNPIIQLQDNQELDNSKIE